MLRIRVLGAAAGGGFPQWNVNSEACRRSRFGDVAAPSATQASIAISADGERWFIVNASPDLREQIAASAILHPKNGLRSSPIAGVVLTNADVDAIAGLLHLREGTAFAIYAPQSVLKILKENRVFEVVDETLVPRRELRTEAWQSLATAAGEDLGIEVRTFSVPGKVPLYLEDEQNRPRSRARKRRLRSRYARARAPSSMPPTALTSPNRWPAILKERRSCFLTGRSTATTK